MTSRSSAPYAADPRQGDPEKPNHRTGADGDDCETKHPKPTVTVTRTATATVTSTSTSTVTATVCGTGVDSTQPNGMEQFLAALVNGTPCAGRRPDINTTPDNPNIVSGPADAPGWIDLSTIAGFPTDSPVCDISVDTYGSDAFYKIITQGGPVSTLHCAANGTSRVSRPGAGSDAAVPVDNGDTPAPTDAARHGRPRPLPERVARSGP
ncbi:hypothetical protein [Streptomyces sp. NPDC007905]|uniref:hypothetical protein n=1 Tax=Streptomyces sp. NPDC007905 TaxID=3364788 RepID=UPI0036E46B02